jgi:hypothetical protein
MGILPVMAALLIPSERLELNYASVLHCRAAVLTLELTHRPG